MKVLVAKHYWKNGENATWECHPKLDKKVFEYLKENYHNFVKDRKNKIEKFGYFIYPCYVDAKDDHERDITNITFFVSKSKVNTNLCNQKYNNLELKIKEHKSKKIIMGINIIAFLLIGFLVINLLESKNSSSKEYIVEEKVQDYSLFIKNWNDQVQKITDEKKFLLTRDNNIKLIEQLNDFEKPFYEDFNSSSFDEYKQGDIKKYKKYLSDNHINNVKVFKKTMSRDGIEKSLQKITKENTKFSIVSKVLMMNDIDIFLKENK